MIYSTLDRYLGFTLLKNISIVLLVILVIQFFTLFAQEVSHLAKDYQITQAVIYALLYLPFQAYEILPVILLIGGIIGLGTLANGSELTIIRATGESIQSVTRSVAKTGIPLVLVMFCVGEIIAFPLVNFAEEYRAISLGKKVSLSQSDDFWIKDSDVFINIKSVQSDSNGEFSSFKVDASNNLREIIIADRVVPTNDGWHLYNVSITKISDLSVETLNYQDLELKTEFDKEGIGKLTLNPRDISLFQLYGYAQYLEQNNLESDSYFFSFWQRSLQPLSALAMLFLALPFVFGSLREKSISQRVMTGVFLGTGFFIVSQMVNHLSIISDIPSIVGAAIPASIIISLWIILLRRGDRLS